MNKPNNSPRKKTQINQILEEITNKNSIYNEIIDNILYPNLQYKDELISELAISFIKNKKKIIKSYNNGWFKYMFITAVKNQVHSKTSPFHKNVRETISSKYNTQEFNVDYIQEDNEDLEYKMDIERKLEIINKARELTKTNYFEAEVFKLYFDKDNTYRGIEKKYDIDHCLAYYTVQKVVTKLKQNINDIQNGNTNK